MKIQYFIFNYAHFDNALSLYSKFNALDCETYLLNCASPKDPPFEETSTIIKLPNIYYSGQWNEALKMLDADVMFITNADVVIPNVDRLVQKMNNFYKRHPEAAIYAPNLHWTPWTFNPHILTDVGAGCKQVPATDSTIWSVAADIAHKVGPMDLSVNRLGWGIEILAAWHGSLEKRMVVRDYSIKCQHPQNTAYDRQAADREQRTMIEKMGISKSFWAYYNSRSKYGFGWRGDDNPEKFTEKISKMFI